MAAGTLSPEAAFPEAETAETEGSTGVLRLSMESSAFVCACCTVTGEVACGEEKSCQYTLINRIDRTTDLFECMARHGVRVNVLRSDGGPVVVVEVIEHSHRYK